MKNGYKYRKAIVTFIDILGFRELIKTKTPSEIGEALALLDVLSEGEKGGGEPEAGLTKTIKFSDSVVRVCPIDSDMKLGSLFYELLALVQIQAELAAVGVFLRGGLTVGDVYMSDGIIFGPAMVRAYDLESKFAIFPRIVLDPSVLKHYVSEPAMQGHAHDMEKDIQYLEKLVREGDDQVMFIDYLRAIHPEMDDPEDYPQYLASHRKMIVSAFNGLSKFDNAKHKYLWLAGYHNSIIADLKDEFPEDLQPIEPPDWGVIDP